MVLQDRAHHGRGCCWCIISWLKALAWRTYWIQYLRKHCSIPSLWWWTTYIRKFGAGCYFPFHLAHKITVIFFQRRQDDSQQDSSCGSSPWPLQPSSRGKLILPLCMFPPIMPCIKAKVSSVEWNGKCKNNGPRSFSESKHLLDQRGGRIYTLHFNVRLRC